MGRLLFLCIIRPEPGVWFRPGPHAGPGAAGVAIHRKHQIITLHIDCAVITITQRNKLTRKFATLNTQCRTTGQVVLILIRSLHKIRVGQAHRNRGIMLQGEGARNIQMRISGIRTG